MNTDQTTMDTPHNQVSAPHNQARRKTAALTAHDSDSVEIAERIIREPECRKVTGLSRSTRWRMERRGLFPRRRCISPGCCGWYFSEIASWLADRAYTSRADEHAQMVSPTMPDDECRPADNETPRASGPHSEHPRAAPKKRCAPRQNSPRP